MDRTDSAGAWQKLLRWVEAFDFSGVLISNQNADEMLCWIVLEKANESKRSSDRRSFAGDIVITVSWNDPAATKAPSLVLWQWSLESPRSYYFYFVSICMGLP